MLTKINYLLNKNDKIKLFLIFIVVLISAFLDLLGISAILPVVEILEKGPFAVDNNLFLSAINRIFNLNYDSRNICLVALGFLGAFFLIKCAYSFFSIYVINKFTMTYSRRLTNKLMNAYLLFPYEYHLDNNSSTLIRKSTYDVDMFTGAITEMLNFVVKAASGLCVVVFLYIQDWKVTLILFGLMLIFSAIVLILIKPKSKKIGVELQKYYSENYKYLSQAFNGIKESKIGNSESYFTSIYDKNRATINGLSLKRVLLNSVPSTTLEFIGMIGICLSLAITILLNTPAEDIVITFSVFAYAVIKLLPSVTTITTTINNFHFYNVSINSLYDDIKLTENKDYAETEEKEVIKMPFENEISVNNVSFYYQSNPTKYVLNNINVKIKKNTSIAFSGVSGAGKTTIIDLILGLLPCREGNITCDGVNIKTNMRGWRTNISYIPQNIYLSDDTIRNNVAFGIDRKFIDDSKIWDALEKAQLKEYVENLPKKLDTVIGERGVRMSGGQRQRIGIARAFFRNTNIIVFDEATSALDYDTERNILDHVSKYSKDHTLIIITHRLNTIDSCDSIYKVENCLLTKIK